MKEDEAQRLKALEQENARLKKLLAERDLAIEVMKEINAKNVWSAPDLQGLLASMTKTVCTNVSGLSRVSRFRRPGHDEIRARRS